MTIPKPGDLADRLVREHADRIADTVTRVKHVRRCVEFHISDDLWSALVVRDSNGDYTAITISTDDLEAWSIPETDRQIAITLHVIKYCRTHDAEIRLAIDAALAPDPIAVKEGVDHA